MKLKIKVLSESEIKEKLKELPGWEYKNGRLIKTFKLKSFMDVIYLVDRLAPFFEELDHHADMEIEHRKIMFKLWRFDIGMKVTNYDFLVAEKIEAISKQFPKA